MRHEYLPVFALVLLVLVSGCISGDIVSDRYVDSENGGEGEQYTEDVTPQVTIYNIGDLLSNGEAELTVNSVRKEKYIDEYFTPEEGIVYLIVDFTIRNIGLEEGYSFNPNYVSVQDEDFYSYDYSWNSFSLQKCFDVSTIDLGQTVRGELAFEVPEDSERYTFILKSGIFFERNLAYVYLRSVKTPETVVNSSVFIDSVNWNWIDYGDLMPGQGAIYSVDVLVENTGNEILYPKYDLRIRRERDTVLSKYDIQSYVSVEPGETVSDSISLVMLMIDEPGKYEFKVTLYNQGSDVPLDTVYEDVRIS